MTSERARIRLRPDVEDQLGPLAKAAGMSVTDYANGLLRICIYNQMRPGRSYAVRDTSAPRPGAPEIDDGR